MSARRCGAAAAVLVVALAAGGCGKSEEPKVDAAAEKAAAMERAKQRAYGGTEVRALEKANKLGADLNEKAQARDPDSK